MDVLQGLLKDIVVLYTPVVELLKSLGLIVGKIALAVVFFSVSVWVLGLVKVIVEWLLGVLSIEKLANVLGINRLVKKVSPGGFTATLVTIAYWIAMVGILVSTFKLLGVSTRIGQTVQYMADMLPSLLSALFVIIVAVLLAGFAGNLVRLIASYFADVNAEILGKLTSFTIILYAVIVAVGQLQVISPDLVNTALVVSFIGFVLAAALGSTKEAAALVKEIFAEVKKLVTGKKKK